MALSIPISELNTLNQVSSSDLIAIVQQSTLTTFNTTLDVVAAWISSSVGASSSFASFSSSYALSSSFAQVGGSSSYALSLIYPNTSTASYAITASNALSASWSPVQGVTAFSISSSWASASIWATSSSFASQSISSSWAPYPASASWSSASLTSLTTTSSSYADVSITASYAATASYVPTASINAINFIKAFGMFYATGSLGTPFNQSAFIPYSGSYNFGNAVYVGNTYQAPGYGGMQTGSVKKVVGMNYGNAHTWIFNMNTPLPTTNYTIICAHGGEQGTEWMILVNYPDAARTTTAFSMSYVGGTTNWDGNRSGDPPNKFDWVSLMVLHP
jgi:hypothetical protein